MKRNIGWLLCAVNLLAPRSVAVGQQVLRFDSAYVNQGSGWALGVSVFERDSGYLVFSVQKTWPFDDGSQDIYSSTYDTLGRWQQDRALVTERSDWIGNYSPVARSLTGDFYTGYNRFTGDDQDSLFLLKWDENGDTIWNRFLEVDETYTVRATAFTHDSTLLLTGNHEPPLNAYIYEVDTMGVVLGFHTYPGFYPEDVAVGADGAWYVSGQGFQTNIYGRSVLIRTNTLGSEVWRRTDTTYGNSFQLVPTRDSCIVVLGWRSEAETPARAKLVKYDPMGVQQWMKEPYSADFDEVPCYLHAGFEDPDGTFIVAGQVRDTTYGQAGMLFKLDSEGNTIWQRFYAHYPSFLINDDQIFNDVKRTSDGGLILTGETNGGEHPYAQLWLLKLDSAGCLVPGCGSVGGEEYTDLFQGQLQVWPNPASERVQVSLTLPEGFATRGAVQLYLMDAQGRIVGQQVAQQNFNVITGAMELSAHPRGTYYLHLADSKRWLAGGKLVVE